MRSQHNRIALLRSIGVSDNNLVTPKQIHGNTILEVDNKSTDRSIEADGLISFQEKGNKKNTLGVIVADCVPILFADRNGRAIGATHAGWKSTFAGIAKKMVIRFSENGIHPQDIFVFLGPHIGSCCYSVPEDRARKFPLMAEKRESEWYLDLGRENITQLRKAGIKEDHIEDCDLCTSCHIDTFFSYRKDTTHSYGEILAFIGYI